MRLYVHIFLIILTNVYGVHNFELFEILQRKSIEDEITFHLFHYTNHTLEYNLYINDEASIINSPFNQNLSTKFIIHGWTQGQESFWVQEMREVMAATQKWNVIVVDWSPMSYTVYSDARIHTRLVGQRLADMCIFLINLGCIRLESVHFIGHSMGAHIAGYASQIIKEKFNQAVDRITALDPIAYMFEYPNLEHPNERLDKDDAHFVDVIHTNGRQLGMMNAIGDADFYPNGGMQQPGCGSFMCSHERSCEFWIASVKNPCEYKAISYDSWEDYLNGETKGLLKVPMGIAAGAFIPKGLYFLETSQEYPYVNTYTNTLDLIK